MTGHQQIVHLATPIRGNAGTREVIERSVEMVRLVLEAAQEVGVQRVIIPSSIRALAQDQLRGSSRVTIETSRPADDEYGRTRIEVEALGRQSASTGMEVACLRLGTVRFPDVPLALSSLRPHWLSHEDCAGLFRACVQAPLEPGRFTLFYAVSDLPERILDTSNPFGWVPQSRKVGLKRKLIAAISRANTGVRGRLRIRTRFKQATTGRKA
jgi:nucleoside-diphosphate-sugar epimerase